MGGRIHIHQSPINLQGEEQGARQQWDSCSLCKIFIGLGQKSVLIKLHFCLDSLCLSGQILMFQHYLNENISYYHRLYQKYAATPRVYMVFQSFAEC